MTIQELNAAQTSLDIFKVGRKTYHCSQGGIEINKQTNKCNVMQCNALQCNAMQCNVIYTY